MGLIGAATAAENPQMKILLQFSYPARQFLWFGGKQPVGLIQLVIRKGRGIGLYAHEPQAHPPGLVEGLAQGLMDNHGMNAIGHKPHGRPFHRLIHHLYGLVNARSVDEPAIGADGKADDIGQAAVCHGLGLSLIHI